MKKEIKSALPDFWRVVLFPLLLSLLLAGCYTQSDPFKKDAGYTLKDMKEAETIALCLSGAITAPESLSRRVLSDLNKIRSSYGDRIGQINTIRFVAPWLPGCVIIAFDTETARLIENKQYTAWHGLNEMYRLSRLDLRMLKNLDAAVLYFGGLLHSRRLCELYATLPGVRYSHPNYVTSFDSWIYPSSQSASGMTYLFRHGWGDCMAGCAYNEYWYFIVPEAGGPVLVGYWNQQKDHVTPDWWAEAKTNIEQYHKF